MQASPSQAPGSAAAAGAVGLHDLRFRALVGDADWASLPLAVRRRFTERLGAGMSAVYAGHVVETRAGWAGRLLAQAGRLVGGPLPLSRASGLAAVVTVTEEAGGGQAWTRLYARASGFPQIIHSAKRFAGPTGLEEHVGGGLGMALRVTVEDGALVFRSAFYFWQVAGFRLRLPNLLSLTVRHAETGQGRFRFVLEIRHCRLGLLIRQDAVFADTALAVT